MTRKVMGTKPRRAIKANKKMRMTVTVMEIMNIMRIVAKRKMILRTKEARG